jgi:hypothetical protein
LEQNSYVPPNLDIASVNTTTGFAGVCIGKILTEHIRHESRISTMNEKKRKMSEALSNIDKLKLLTRISSGSLAGVGRYHITCDVKDIVKEDHINKKRILKEKEQKKIQKKVNERTTYLQAIGKKKNNHPLNGKDIKSILQHHQNQMTRQSV